MSILIDCGESIDPIQTNFLGQPSLDIIFKHILPDFENCSDKCVVEITITNLTNNSQDYFNLLIPDNSQICCIGCNNKDFKVYNAYYTTLRLTSLIPGSPYLLNSRLSCICPSPTPTPTVSPSVTPTISITPSITPTISITPTNTPTTTPTPTPASIGNSANYNSLASWDSQNGNLTTVGSNGGPSAYGTYDQSGNVWEWNDLNQASGSNRIVRGGNWLNDATFLISSDRRLISASGKDTRFGFRLATANNPLNINGFVTIGDTNNSNDTTGFGSVSYEYQINKYTVTNCEYVQFLNAVGSTDIYQIYSTSMSGSRSNIIRNGSQGSYTYTVNEAYKNKPVIWVSWLDCARYCNWLHNNRPSGFQNASTTEDGAYSLNGIISGELPAKNNNALYWIPTENEWYKAAYYKSGGTNAGYWLYATQSNNIPIPVSADSIGNGIINNNPARVSDYVCPELPPTPTPTSTATATPTPTSTATATPTPTSTATATPTPTSTATATPTPTSTPTPTPTPEPQIPGNNSANYDSTANWNSSFQGNVTTVGTNGRSSFYGTYDQSGNTAEWVDSFGIGNSSSRMILGGGFTDSANRLSGSQTAIVATNSDTKQSDIGFRISTIDNSLSLNNFVNVEDLSNSPENTTGYGGVSYLYYISQYQITNEQYTIFLNSVDPDGTNPQDIYSTNMSSDVSGGIVFDNLLAIGTKYNVKNNMNNKPVVYINFWNCMRYCNWLHNGAQSYQTSDNTSNAPQNQGAYAVGTTTTGAPPAKNIDAEYWLPTPNEWYKAAYYKGGSTSAGYWSYATQSDTIPTPVTANVIGDGIINFIPANILDPYYFNGAGTNSSDWNDIGNWWLDSNQTIPATQLPGSNDSVVIFSTVNQNSGSEPTIKNMFLFYSTVFDISIVVLNSIIFDNFSNNGNNADITSTNTILVANSYNNGLINSTTKLDGSSYNNGTVDGNTVFNNFTFNASNGNILQNAIFNDSSYNAGIVSGNARFNQSSNNSNIVIGDGSFYNNSVHFGSISGNAEFYNSSYTWFGSSILGDAIFNDNTAHYGTIQGNATFNDNSIKSGSVDGTTTCNTTGSCS